MTLQLAYNLSFPDLYRRDGLVQIDDAFLAFLPDDVGKKLKQIRLQPPVFAKEALELLLTLGPYLEDFIAKLFHIENDVLTLQARHHALAPLYRVKRLFIQRRAAKVEHDNLHLYSPLRVWDETDYALQVNHWLDDEDTYSAELSEALSYACWALFTPTGQAQHANGLLFHLPHKIDYDALVHFEKDEAGRLCGAFLRDRRGFSLTDQGPSLEEALAETNYCIWCAHQGRDSCSKGLRDRTTGHFQRNPAGVSLNGCPLEEKISEFQELKSKGFSIAALATICINNPMVAATGHRICNDCMKACIYQKQEPVDIPKAETRTLKDVLSLPWGFEIYSLLTRWNPLNFAHPYPRVHSGYSVMVVGLGPAGFTLAHHLMNDGHHVMAIDGLKIEPLEHALLETPIKNIEDIREDLNVRTQAGFGGVAEYGITVRWDKNNLKLIRLLLERRAQFAYASGVRMGGTLTLDDIFAAGFDHVALCMGAGRPTLVKMKNGLAQGVRQASDFLMALQLTGAAKQDNLANLEIELPVVVIGGGLTAIDTATEALAYYPVQVEKFLQRYEKLGGAFDSVLTEREKEKAQKFITHAQALRNAQSVRERIALLNHWGGVTIAYRRDIKESPAYTLNHEEIELALQEGIKIQDHAQPLAIEVDAEGHVAALEIESRDNVRKKLLARTVLVAAGTQPNVVLAREDKGIMVEGRFFQAVDENDHPVMPQASSKPDHVHVLMKGHRVSFFGDLHPSFAGNVVKAMASALRGYPFVTKILAKTAPQHAAPAQLLTKMKTELSAHVVDVITLAPNIVEIKIKAPRAAQKFQPGQFYRLQNFEQHAVRRNGTVFMMEGLALTGAKVEGDVLSLIVLNIGASSFISAQLKKDEPVILMGPTGTPTHIPHNETVLLIGGGLGNAVLFSIGKACREKGCRVLYFAGYKKLSDRYKVEEIEAACDQVVWCCDEGVLPCNPVRPHDISFKGNMIEALLRYAQEVPQGAINLREVDRIVCIGSDGLMRAVAQARAANGALASYLNPAHVAIGSINSPMQCMMKEICAQCLQRHVDPHTGEEKIVFSCSDQDQNLDFVDFSMLRQRLEQNSLMEKLSKAWVMKCENQECP